MNYNINVDTDLLREKNNQLRKVASELETNVESVLKQAEMVQTGWTGANSDAYVEAFKNFKPKMDIQVETMRNTADNIDKIITLIENNRNQISDEINKI